MPDANINLTDHYDRFVQDQIAAGRLQQCERSAACGPAIDCSKEEIREDEAKLAARRRLAAEGFESRSIARKESPSKGDGQQLASIIGKSWPTGSRAGCNRYSRPGTLINAPVPALTAGRTDIEAILEWSHEEFGEKVRRRYEAVLLIQAIADLGEEPERPASHARPEARG